MQDTNQGGERDHRKIAIMKSAATAESTTGSSCKRKLKTDSVSKLSYGRTFGRTRTKRISDQIPWAFEELESGGVDDPLSATKQVHEPVSLKYGLGGWRNVEATVK